jgi:hypothetical protein
MNKYGLDIALLVSGFAGAILFLKKVGEKSIASGFISLLSGSLCANYLTPFISDLLQINGDSRYGVGFVLGYIGLKGVEKIANKLLKKL